MQSNKMALIEFTFSMTVLLLIGGVTAQPGWPPLVTTCDVMPLVAADANTYGKGHVACACSSWPDCYTINCEIISNNDQLEMRLVPCGQYPAIWIKSHAIGGGVTFQDGFASSRVVSAEIGGVTANLNVTIVQRGGITLGFGVSVTTPGSGPPSTVPYRDIPLNLTECPEGPVTREYPLMCRMILYMEQSIITTYSGRLRDPALVPQCDLPDTDSCDFMKCSWNNSGSVITHSYKFFRCQNPQAVNLVMSGPDGVPFLNETFTDSCLKTLDDGTVLNITVKHPSYRTMGLEVKYTTKGGNITEIPYVLLPLDTNGCPPPPPLPAFQPDPNTFPRPRTTATLYKHGHEESSPDVPSVPKQAAAPKVASPSVEATAPNHTHLPPPLITMCDAVPSIAATLTTFTNGVFNSCHSSPSPNCTHINCTVTSGEVTLIDFMPCSNPPFLHLTITDGENNTVLSNVPVTESGIVNISLNNFTVPLNFTMVQHTEYLTIGLEVFTGNSTLLPYREIPMDRLTCPGVTVPPITCATLLNIATYVNFQLSSDFDWYDCTVSTTSCNNLTCTNSFNSSLSFLLSPCDPAITIAFNNANDSFNTDFSRTFRRTGMAVLDNTTRLNVLINFNTTLSMFGVQVGIVYQDINNHGNTISVTLIPYTDIPVNLDACPSMDPNAPLIRTCDMFPLLASEATAVVNSTLVCRSSPPPGCDRVVCNIVSDNSTLIFRVLPCHSPPAVQLANVAANGTTTLNVTLVNTTLGMVTHIGDDPRPGVMNVTIVQHRQMLTLGVAINATVTTNRISPPLNVSFMKYYELPVNRAQCADHPNMTTPTCQVMSRLAQYLNVFVANMTHQPVFCYVIPESLCHNITCPDPTGGLFNVSILPCGDKLGIHMASSNASNVTTYSVSLFESTTYHFTPHISGVVTLAQDSGGNEITVQMDLYHDNDSFIGTEIPLVVIPVDKEVCKTKPPPVHNHTVDFAPLITSCDVLPLLAREATGAVPDTLFCHSSSPPDCDRVACNVISNNDTLNFRVLPCHSPPAIQLANLAINGTTTFNVTLINTTLGMEAQIGDDPAIINVTILQHGHGKSLGVMIHATITHSEQRIPVLFVPYYEIPLKSCSNESLDTDTCRVMDNVAQYMSIFFANLQHKIGRATVCMAVHSPASLCNTVRCTAPSVNSTFSLLPCSDPIGLTGGYGSSDGSWSNYTLYSSGVVNISADMYVEVTLDQVAPHVVGMALFLNNNTASFPELPYVHIPVNTSRCGNRPRNHTHPSLIDTCSILADIANTATGLLPGVTCTSSDCPTVSCVELVRAGRKWNFTIDTCSDSQFSPAVEVSATGPNGTVLIPKTRLDESMAIPANPGGSQMLYVEIIQHSSNLSIGLEVAGTIIGGNRTFIPYKEIPIDRSACLPDEVFSDTCAELRNISQYINFVISNITGEPTDCTPSELCDGIMCRAGTHNSSLTVSVDRCGIPPQLTVVLTNPNGTVVFNQTVADSEILSWDVLSAVLRLNLTVQHFNASSITVKVTFDDPGGPGTLLMVPTVTIPVNTTGCSTSPTYSTQPLVTACDITPLIAASAFPPLAFTTLRCTASPPPNCSRITCSVPESGDSVSFNFEPCYGPPAITVENYVNGVKVLHKTFAHSLKFNFSTANVPMRVSLTQHHDMTSVGFKVDVTTADNTTIPFLPYREIPADHYKCSGAFLSPTCRVMSNVAQYMTVFMANLTTDAGSTLDCFADRHSLCNNITCAEPSTGQHFNYSFQACEGPISFSISRGFSDGSFVKGSMYNRSQQILLFGKYEAQLTLNSLSENLVQFKIELTSDDYRGVFIPMVNVPLDDALCGTRPPTIEQPSTATTKQPFTATIQPSTATTKQPFTATIQPSTATTKQPFTKDNNKLVIAVATPVGLILAIIILVSLVILAYYHCVKKKLSDEPYEFRPLSDFAEEGEDNLLSGPPDTGGAYQAFSDPPDKGEDGGAHRPFSEPDV